MQGYEKALLFMDFKKNVKLLWNRKARMEFYGTLVSYGFILQYSIEMMRLKVGLGIVSWTILTCTCL